MGAPKKRTGEERALAALRGLRVGCNAKDQPSATRRMLRDLEKRNLARFTSGGPGGGGWYLTQEGREALEAPVTWAEWAAAACVTIENSVACAAWMAGEDPAEWRATSEANRERVTSSAIARRVAPSEVVAPEFEGPHQLARILGSAKAHGDLSGLGYEVGDLEAALRVAWDIMTPDQRNKLVTRYWSVYEEWKTEE